jgi:Ca2+-binding RTX toxin-like protein
VDKICDVVIENADEGIDTVKSSVSYTLAANVENLTLTGTANVTGTGNALNNVITGNSGGNTLDGGLGADTMTGGLGNDTYYVDNAGDIVTENSGEGTDLVKASIDYTLGSNLENLTLAGTTAITGTGNELNNVLNGNALDNVLYGMDGNDVLNGGAGADTLIGGRGNDAYYVDNIGDVITENLGEGTDYVNASVDYTLGTNLENLTLTGTTAITGTGNELNNSLIGNTLDNTLYGMDGNDVLDGGVGADTMIGGLGNDMYYVENIGDIVIENLGEGTDRVNAAFDYTLGSNLENLTLYGTTAITGTGNELDNVLNGNALDNVLYGMDGNDTLNGGVGADTLIGGLGNDTYYVDNMGDVITENPGEGNDLVQSSIDWSLGANLENLILTGTNNINGIGNDLDNVLTGNSGNNWLAGQDGNDDLRGSSGNDILQGGSGTDFLSDTAGANLFDGGSGTDTLTGNSGNELFIGGTGNDTITTGNGADILAFNRGDGADVVNGGIGTDNTISLGQGINYSDIALSKVNNNLILEVGGGEQITLSNWYNTTANYKSVLDLQVMADAMAAFDPASSDPLLSKAVQNFDFTAIVNAFDQARGTSATFMHWSATWQLISRVAIPPHWAEISPTSTAPTAA